MHTQQSAPSRVVHLELHTGDQVRASAFYERLLCWRPELIRASCGSYLAFDAGGGVGGAIVECAARRPLWLPYVEVDGIEEWTERARRLGAALLLEPREGSAGWRSVVSSPEAERSRSGSRSDDEAAHAPNRIRPPRRQGERA